ncbi:hypothetical protein FRB91_011378 [Serendipita sp. 411]|nr:hypothetical protein FRB91_011378 [Serendipita sp. 411]
MATRDQPLGKLPNERVVVVMGPTGSGKTTVSTLYQPLFAAQSLNHSQLINCIAKRDDDPGVGHTIMSCTDELELVKVVEPIHGRSVSLIDTPGFDDTNKPDTEILTAIAEFLVGTYKTGLQLDTILYLHRISDRKMTRSLLKSLRMFVSLCGVQSMPNVVIVTTMWDDVDKKVGETREEELRTMIWYDMIGNGCIVKRFDRTYNSALDLLASTPKMVEGTLLSCEMVDKGKKLKATAAGVELAKQLKDLRSKHKAASRRLQSLSGQGKNELEEELEKTGQQIKNIDDQLAVLKINIFDRMFGSKQENKLVPDVGEKLKPQN